MRDGKHDNLRLPCAINNVKGEALQSGFVDVGGANNRIEIGRSADMRHDRFELVEIVRAQTGQPAFVVR